MNGLGAHGSASDRTFAIAWVGMAIIMGLAVGVVDVLNLPLQTIYVFAAGITLRELLGLAAWFVRT